MFILYLVLIGLLCFVASVGVLGIWLRKHPSKDNAERSSRIMHFLFFAGMVAPPVIGLFYPGLTHFDELLGLNPLPWKTFLLVLGIFLAIPGFYFLAVTNKLLRALGSGANAFRLTKRIVAEDIYKRTRNPMSLGFYLCALALGFVSGSTLVTAIVLLGLVPAHIFFLKYFEELELELRFGESYLEYKESVPFLIPKFISNTKITKENSMNKNFLLHLAGWSAYASAAATIIGAVTLVIFFSVGGPFGIMNDISSVIIGLTGIIILFAMYQLHRSVAPVMSLVAFVIGALAMLTAAVLQTLLVAIRMDFGEITTYAFGLFGASLVAYGYIVLTNGTLPRGLGWWGIVAGLGYVLVDTGFILSGPNHPLTYIGGLASVIAYPAWTIWLGRVLLKSNQ